MAEFRDSVDVAASPENVFDYLTTDSGMTAWMGQFADLDPKPGGRFAVDIAGYPVRGEFLHVDYPTRVVVSWGFVGSDHLPSSSSRVEFRLTAISHGTRVDLIHSDLPDTETRGHAHGWTHFLPRLAVAGSGGDPGPDDWHPLDERASPEVTRARQKGGTVSWHSNLPTTL